jgi:hypothetical protein
MGGSDILFCGKCRVPKRVLYEFNGEKICELCLMEYIMDNDMKYLSDANAKRTAYDLSVLTETTWKLMGPKSLLYAIIFASEHMESNSIDYLTVVSYIKRQSESIKKAEVRLDAYIEILKQAGLIARVERDKAGIVLSDQFVEMIGNYTKGNEEYIIGVLESIIDNTSYSQGIIHSKIRRSVLETIYSKVSADGQIDLDPVTEPVNYVCNECGLPFRLSDKDELLTHLHDDHMISKNETKGHYRVNMKTVGYCVPDDDFAKVMKKYGVIDKTRVDRFVKALKYGAIFNQDSISTDDNNNIIWYVKPEIINYLIRIKELTRDRVRELERTVG